MKLRVFYAVIDLDFSAVIHFVELCTEKYHCLSITVYSEAVTRMCSVNNFQKKIHQIHRKTLVLKSLF